MYPKVIYIVRHGEKPGETHIEHIDDGVNLAPAGRTRATGIAHHAPSLFSVKSHKKINYVFATAKSKMSVRPIETIQPLAEFCKTKINAKFRDEDFYKLAKEITGKKKYDQSVVVICWHHGKIPHLIEALGGIAGVHPIENGHWDDRVFDRVIRMTKTENGILVESLPQRLLYGDSIL